MAGSERLQLGDFQLAEGFEPLPDLILRISRRHRVRFQCASLDSYGRAASASDRTGLSGDFKWLTIQYLRNPWSGARWSFDAANRRKSDFHDKRRVFSTRYSSAATMEATKETLRR